MHILHMQTNETIALARASAQANLYALIARTTPHHNATLPVLRCERSPFSTVITLITTHTETVLKHMCSCLACGTQNHLVQHAESRSPAETMGQSTLDDDDDDSCNSRHLNQLSAFVHHTRAACIARRFARCTCAAARVDPSQWPAAAAAAWLTLARQQSIHLFIFINFL